VTLSEELREQAESQAAGIDVLAAAGQNPTSYAPGPGDLLMLWRPAITIAAIVTAGLSLLAAALPPLELLSWMAPAMVLSIYSSRHRETQITAAVGARVGVVCGIFTAFGISLAMALRMLAQRFIQHRPSDIGANMDQLLAQSKAQALAQLGAAGAAPYDRLLSSPEFHAGFFLSAIGMGSMFLILLSVAGGAFAGFIRSRTRVR